jgi:predicted alternative tryptophan synthase beta-subunit
VSHTLKFDNMLDNIARKRALIETIKRLESDSDLDIVENLLATLPSITQLLAPKPKTRKPKKEAPQSSTLTEEEAKNYVLRYNPSLKVYIKIPKDVAERISKTIDLEAIKKAQNYQKTNRDKIREIAKKMNIKESAEELLDMLKE